MLDWNSKLFWPAVLLLLGTICVVVLAFGQERQGEWELQASRSAGRFRLTLREYSLDRRGSSSFEISVTELRNLPASIRNGSGRASFEVVRDAGRLLCEGSFRNGSGSGNFEFVSNPEYSRELSLMGYGTPTQDQRFSMFLMDVTLEFARAVREAGLIATSRDLIELRIHGVTADYLREARAAGYSNLPSRDIVQMRIHGVSTEFLHDLRNSGYNLSSGEVVDLRIHGVTPDYLRSLRDAGYSGLSVKEITNLRIHGVDPDFIREARRLGYSFTAQELTELRIHGVDAAYLKRLQDTGFRNLSASQIAKLRIHGID